MFFCKKFLISVMKDPRGNNRRKFAFIPLFQIDHYEMSLKTKQKIYR